VFIVFSCICLYVLFKNDNYDGRQQVLVQGRFRLRGVIVGLCSWPCLLCVCMFCVKVTSVSVDLLRYPFAYPSLFCCKFLYDWMLIL
jgi:hypothetical protein